MNKTIEAVEKHFHEIKTVMVESESENAISIARDFAPSVQVLQLEVLIQIYKKLAKEQG
ncbi:hypothetical protein LCGC14_1647210 [marine sediment metagenome]|uniref:Uncharacterized protein n=1 Tax=marine sediment metagenome TaxID=412755 RepID=A0A0F9HXV7_9ZZZZ